MRPYSVFNDWTNQSICNSSFYILSFEIALEILLGCDCRFQAGLSKSLRIIWVSEKLIFKYLLFIRLAKMFAACRLKELLALRQLDKMILNLPVHECSVGDITLSIERVGSVITWLVIIHKIYIVSMWMFFDTSSNGVHSPTELPPPITKFFWPMTVFPTPLILLL